jgi:hypothetical protein
MTEEVSDTWLRRTRRLVTAKDWILLLVGAVLGFAGNALFAGDLPTLALMIVAGVLTVSSVIALDRFRYSADIETRSQLLMLKNKIDEHHDSLRRELEVHLDQVHSAAAFVPQGRANGSVNGTNSAGYSIATDAVVSAKSRILVIGDYSPPRDQGTAFDPQRLPPKRGGYLEAIEHKLTERLQSDESHSQLVYTRYIQRPLDIYNEIRARDTATPGIVLRGNDMVGDEQAFEHCRRVLEIKAAAKSHGDKVRIDLRIIPFLPNCPSVLLVDRHQLQFTIPTRINEPGDHYAALGLLGVLVLNDIRGEKICKHFDELFNHLVNFSVFVRGVEPAAAEPPEPAE